MSMIKVPLGLVDDSVADDHDERIHRLGCFSAD